MTTQPLPTGTRTQRFEHISAAEQAFELDRLPDALKQEQVWLDESRLHPHEDKAGILGSIASGQIVGVPSGNHMPFRQYYQDRVRPSEVAALPESMCSVPYLRPEALAVLMHVTVRAKERFMDSTEGREYLREFDLTDIQYSVTSMLRSRIYQRRLTQENALALDGDSAHLFGIAFDVDHSGFYVRPQNAEGVISVNGLQNPSLYTDGPVHAFHKELEDSVLRDELAFITELPGGRGCWHISANPQLAEDYLVSDRFQSAVT